jgi:Zn-dependent alcohol dehydrogenase
MHAQSDGVELNPVLGIGTFCTYTLVHSKQCIPVDPELPKGQMSLIGCGVMTGIGAALYTASVEPGSSVAVFGCGGVGDSVIMGSRIAGATKIIAVDLDNQKLEWAKGFGATDLVNPRNGDPVQQIKDLTDGNGVNFSFEAVGRPDTTLQAITCRDLAGTCVIIGVGGPSSTIENGCRGTATACRQEISRCSRTGTPRAASISIRSFRARSRSTRRKKGSTQWSVVRRFARLSCSTETRLSPWRASA